MDLIYPAVATPHPERSWELVPGVPVTHSTMGVLLPAKHVKFGLAVDAQADTSSIPNKERRVLLAAGDLPKPPCVNCLLKVGADTWKVVSTIPLQPAGIDIIYTLQVRQ